MSHSLSVTCPALLLSSYFSQFFIFIDNTAVTHAQVRESWSILKEVHRGKHTLALDEFDEVFGFWLGDSEPHFNFWSNRRVSGSISMDVSERMSVWNKGISRMNV